MKKKIIAISLCLILVAAGLSGCGKSTKVSSNNPVIADGLCKINVTGETNLPGNFFLSFVFSRNLIMLDGKGNIVWSKHEEQPYEGATTGFWDFKKHIIDGKTYYSYHDQTGKFDDYGLTGYAPGERVILDENFNEVKRITAEESSVTPKGQGIDGHDFYMFDLDHYICSVYIKDNVKNIPGYPEGSNVIYSYLQEVQNGKVVWEFKSIDYPEIYDIVATDATPNANDFANKTIDAPDINHFNAMRVDNDFNLICSFRHRSFPDTGVLFQNQFLRFLPFEYPVSRLEVHQILQLFPFLVGFQIVSRDAHDALQSLRMVIETGNVGRDHHILRIP